MFEDVSMQMTLPAVVLTFAAIISFASAVYSWQQKSPGGWYFILMMVSISFWAITYSNELVFSSAALKINWAKVEYFGSASLPVFWLLFSAHYTQRNRWLSRWRIFFLFLIPLFTLVLVFTNEWHHLIWTSIKPESIESDASLVYEHGFVFWIYTLYSYMLIIIGTIWLLLFAFRSHKLYRRQVTMLIMGALIPFLANVLYILKLNPIPSLDLTPIAFTITGGLLTWGLFNYRMIDLTPIAREVLIERMRDGVIVLNQDNYIVDINPAAGQLLHLKPGIAIGQPIRNVLSRWNRLLDQYKDTMETQVEFTLDEEQWIDLSISPLYGNGQALNGRLIVIRDITRRKNEEVTLKLSEKRYHDLYAATRRQTQHMELINQINNAMARELDVKTISCIAVEGIAATFSYPLVCLYFRQSDLLVLEYQIGYPIIYEQIPVNQGISGRVVRTGKSVLIENVKTETEFLSTMSKINSEICVPLFDQEKVIGIINVETNQDLWLSSTDLQIVETIANQISIAIRRARLYTEAKQAEEALDKERRLLRTVIDNIPDQIFARDKESRFTLSNLSDARVMGVSDPETLVGKKDDDFYPPELAALYQSDNRAVMESELPLINREEPSIDANRNERWTLTTKIPLRNSQGQVIGLVGISRDITEQKKVAIALEEARHQAEVANQAKSAFLANMSHEIRTPLNAILGFSQLSLRDPSLTPTQHHNLNAINRSGEHLLAIINDILEISKIEAGKMMLNPKNFDLHALIHDLETMFQVRTDEKHLTLQVEVDSSVPRYFLADENKLRQILTNLLGNAVKFTQHGSVSLRVSAIRLDDQHWRLSIVVKDTGPGIAKEDLDKLFQVFQQAPAGITAGGTGLGLAISQRYAILMGSNISVKSELGQGSCFSLELDVEQGETISLDTKHSEQKIVGIVKQKHLYRVLIVDEKIENRELLRELLNPLGFELREVGDGQKALSEWGNWSPHLIIMDIRLPVMDGFEVTRRIRSSEKDSHIPIIVATASAFEEDRQKIIKQGVDGYLRKPFQEQALFNLIAACLNIEYKYEPEQMHIADAQSTVIPFSSKACPTTAIPAEMISRLQAAAMAADLDQVLELIDQVTSLYPQIANDLRQFANRLQYDELLYYLHER